MNDPTSPGTTPMPSSPPLTGPTPGPPTYTPAPPAAEVGAGQQGPPPFNGAAVPQFTPPPPRPEPAPSPGPVRVTLSSATRMIAVVAVAVVVSLCTTLVGGAALYALGVIGDDDPGVAATRSTAVGVDGLDVAGILSNVRPSVVAIRLSTPDGEGTGTGIVVDREGHIITNSHVIGDGEVDGAAIEVTFAGGETAAATVVGAVPGEDLALLAVDALPASAQPAALTDADPVVGEPVVAIGNALDLGEDPSVTTGIISATGRTIATPGVALTGLIQTDAAINPGNSGGPLVNAAGEVVGVNTAIAAGANSIGFSIPARSVMDLLGDLREGGVSNPDGGYLGVSTINVEWLDPAEVDTSGLAGVTGAYVTSVEEGGPAASAGLAEGDVIVSVDDTEITGSAQLGRAVRAAGADTTVTLEVRNGEATRDVDVTLGRR